MMNVKMKKKSKIILTVSLLLIFLASLSSSFYFGLGLTPQEISLEPERQQINIIGYGKGSGSNNVLQSISPPTGGSPTIIIGKYHQASKNNGNAPFSVPSTTTFDLKDYPLGDPFNDNDYAAVMEESVSQSKSEVVITIVNFGRLETGGSTLIKYSDPGDVSKFLFEYSIDIPDPNSQSWCIWDTCWWDWYSVSAWIGHFNHEITLDDPVTEEHFQQLMYLVQIQTPWGSEGKWFKVVDTSYVPPVCTEGQQETATCTNGNIYVKRICENNAWKDMNYGTEDPCATTTNECSTDQDCLDKFRICGGYDCLSNKCKQVFYTPVNVTNSPCNGAEYDPYPLCKWDTSKCINPPPDDLNKGLLYGSIGLSAISLISLIFVIRRKK